MGSAAAQPIRPQCAYAWGRTSGAHKKKQKTKSKANNAGLKLRTNKRQVWQFYHPDWNEDGSISRIYDMYTNLFLSAIISIFPTCRMTHLLKCLWISYKSSTGWQHDTLFSLPTFFHPCSAITKCLFPTIFELNHARLLQTSKTSVVVLSCNVFAMTHCEKQHLSQRWKTGSLNMSSTVKRSFLQQSHPCWSDQRGGQRPFNVRFLPFSRMLKLSGDKGRGDADFRASQPPASQFIYIFMTLHHRWAGRSRWWTATVRETAHAL